MKLIESFKKMKKRLKLIGFHVCNSFAAVYIPLRWT